MSKKYPDYKQLDLPKLAGEMLTTWEQEDTFRKSVDEREAKAPFPEFIIRQNS